MEKIFILTSAWFSSNVEDTKFLKSIFSLLGIEFDGIVLFINRVPNDLEVVNAIIKIIVSEKNVEAIRSMIFFAKLNNLLSFEDETEIGIGILSKIGISKELFEK